MTAKESPASPQREPQETPQATEVVFTIGGTAVRVKPAVLANLLGLWGLTVWLAGRGHPERPWSLRFLAGLLSTIAMMVADFGHAMAHIVSARYAGAPMDEILISEGMPRTLYYHNDVPPRVHRLRALGGPIYSAVGLATSYLLRALAPRDSLAREVAGGQPHGAVDRPARLLAGRAWGMDSSWGAAWLPCPSSTAAACSSGRWSSAAARPNRPMRS